MNRPVPKHLWEPLLEAAELLLSVDLPAALLLQRLDRCELDVVQRLRLNALVDQALGLPAEVVPSVAFERNLPVC